jgi:probable HAF family extracellular repeat protein
MRINHPALLPAVALLLSLGAGHAEAQGYTLRFLGTVGGSNSSASAINNSGIVVGASDTAGNVSRHAALWANSSYPLDLGAGSQGNSAATDINSLGQVVGNAFSNGSSAGNAALTWKAPGFAAAVELTHPGDTNGTTVANGINDAGKIVGSAQTADYFQHATLWQTPTDPADIGGGGALAVSAAQGINNLGQIVGWNDSNLGGAAVVRYAVLWGPSLMQTPLGTLGGAQSFASSINDAGDIAGNAQRPGSTTYRATRWDTGAYANAIDLGTLGGEGSFAQAINASGWVVGQAQNSSGAGRAALWQGNVAVDLNTLVDPSLAVAGWVLSNAADINDNGWIVGTTTNSVTGVSYGYLLTPSAVPEPQTTGLLLAGLGLLMALKKRRAIARG